MKSESLPPQLHRQRSSDICITSTTGIVCFGLTGVKNGQVVWTARSTSTLLASKELQYVLHNSRAKILNVELDCQPHKSLPMRGQYQYSRFCASAPHQAESVKPDPDLTLHVSLELHNSSKAMAVAPSAWLYQQFPPWLQLSCWATSQMLAWRHCKQKARIKEWWPQDFIIGVLNPNHAAKAATSPNFLICSSALA